MVILQELPARTRSLPQRKGDIVFEQTFVNTSAQTRRPWTVAVSVALQTGLVAIAFLAPLMHIAALQRPQPVPIWLPPRTLREQPPQPAARAAAPTVPTNRPVFLHPPLQMPTTVPAHIEMTPDAPEPPSTFVAGPAGPSVFAGLQRTTISPAPAPTALVKPPQPAPTAPVPVGGAVQSAKLVFGPRPAYPHTALITRTMGMVRIQAIIGRDGSISNLQVLSGHPLLIEAAKQAVQQWRYQPTLLNGQPVEVITEIDVNFTIGQ
jgi:periplasmic protein TonB